MDLFTETVVLTLQVDGFNPSGDMLLVIWLIIFKTRDDWWFQPFWSVLAGYIHCKSPSCKQCQNYKLQNHQTFACQASGTTSWWPCNLTLRKRRKPSSIVTGVNKNMVCVSRLSCACIKKRTNTVSGIDPHLLIRLCSWWVKGIVGRKTQLRMEHDSEKKTCIFSVPYFPVFICFSLKKTNDFSIWVWVFSIFSMRIRT